MRSLLLAAGSILPLLTGVPAQAAEMPVKTEKYMAFGATSILFNEGVLGIFPAEIKQRVQAVKAGLNYKLDWGVAPTSY